MSGSVEAVSEEKARKVLDRVDFLTKLREEVVVREDLADVLEEHAELALDLPEWWQPGKHDHDLVVGAARWEIFSGSDKKTWPKNWFKKLPPQ